jgi:NAD+ synthase (glutamine-hydrolysing)
VIEYWENTFAVESEFPEEDQVSQNLKLTGDLGFIRIAAAVPQLRVADVNYNLNAILKTAHRARSCGVQVLAFPEMAITGYTLGDLVQHQALLWQAEKNLLALAQDPEVQSMMIMVGAPLVVAQKIYNCAVVINNGRIIGVVPKTRLPGYKEFYDGRWFESGENASVTEVVIAGQTIPFGSDLLFRINGISTAVAGLEVCEDLWVPLSPHEKQALAGASLLFNLSASNEILGKADWRRSMVVSESGRCLASYCYVSSSIGESSNDVVFSGHAMLAENGVILEESPRFCREDSLIISDIDIDRLAFDRRQSTSFYDRSNYCRSCRLIESVVADAGTEKLYRTLDPHPFVPSDASRRAERCREIRSMQVAALAKKLSGAGKHKIVLGVSGGLDSTLALLAAVKTLDFLQLPRTSLYAYTLPGFGTTDRTKNNAVRLCQSLGVSFREVDITRSCHTQFEDLEHQGKEDVVFENVQARYRTAFLFNKANELDAIMMGTGDLTEVALGWSTFAGDQISHYHINISVPKTLVRYIIRWVADEELENSEVQKILYDILDTPISPELLRPNGGSISQKSEEIIGPVELADFFLYPFIRFGMRPGKILFLADWLRKQGLFEAEYSLDDLNKWFQSFIRRFFANQFKRTCFPEGPKIGSVSLSPRGDWRMPSDADPALWLADLQNMYQKLRSSR